MTKPMVMVVHSQTYEGNGRSGAHLSAAIDHDQEQEMCEIRMSLHFSFTGGHPAAMAFGKALNVFNTAVEIEKHVREAHKDGSCCPVAAVSAGKDWGDLQAMEIYCPREKDS